MAWNESIELGLVGYFQLFLGLGIIDLLEFVWTDLKINDFFD